MNLDIPKILERHRLWLLGDEGGSRANLSKANLREFDLSGAILSGANLSHAILRNANLRRTNFRGANLQYTNLKFANFSDASLRYARLYGANLHGACLENTKLTGAYIRGAFLSWSSHDLLAEILWRVARTESQQMLAAFICKKTDWCWDEWEIFEHPDRDWALKTLAKWVKDGDGAPDCVRSQITEVQG